MSINTPNTPGSSNLYTYDVKPEVDSLIEENIRNQQDLDNLNFILPGAASSVRFDQVPIASVKSELLSTYNIINNLLAELITTLSNVNIRSDLTTGLINAHHEVCDQVLSKKIKDAPSHISFEEYSYCLRSKTRACRLLIAEYEILISGTVVGYYYDIMSVYNSIAEELRQLIKFMDITIGEEYDDEVEQTLSKEIFYWAKSYKEYTQLFAKEVFANPPKIPETEMDSIGQIQAAQFKAFFSIKVNSYNSEVKKLLRSFKKRVSRHM